GCTNSRSLQAHGVRRSWRRISWSGSDQRGMTSKWSLTDGLGEADARYGESARPRSRGGVGVVTGGTVTCWHLVTGEYPPNPGGVSDYTAGLAAALAAAGQAVHVWAPGAARLPGPEPSGVEVHRIARFSPLGLGRLDRELDRFASPRTILIQYVPHAFG